MSMIERERLFTSTGKPIFLSLIQELRDYNATNKHEPIFTIRDEKEGLISLKKLFVEHTADDPTEVTFAQVVFGSVDYWLAAREMVAFRPHLEEWRKEADLERKRIAFQAIISEVKEGGRSAFSAAKYLIDEPWKTAKDRKQSKETTEKAFQQVRSNKDIAEDWERIQSETLN